MRRVTIIALLMCFLLTTGCAGNNSGATPQNAMSVKAETMGTAEQVYAAEEMDFPQAMWFSDVGNIAAHNGKIYLVGGFLENCWLYSLNSDGTNLELLATNEGRNENWFSYCADDERVYIYDSFNNCLIAYSLSGERLGNISLPENVTANKIAAANGRLYTLGDGKLNALRLNGDKADLDYSLSAGEPASFIVNSSGALLVSRQEGEKQAISTLDPDAKNWSETQYLDTPCTIVGTCADGRLYLEIDSAVYSYYILENRIEKLFSFSDIGLNRGALCELDDGRFLFTGNSSNISAERPYILSPVSIDAEKVSLTLATTDMLPHPLEMALRDWNRAHPESTITLRDYSVYNTADDPQGGERQLVVDVASNNAPDIYNLSVYGAAMNASLLARRGLLTDLNPFLEQDSELKRTNFIESALNVLETDGKLYQITPSFQLLSCTAPLRDVGTAEMYSYNALEQLTVEHGGYYKRFFTNIYGRDSWLELMVSASGSKLVDWQRGECNFNSEYFMRLLSLACRQPVEAELPDGSFINYISNSGALLNLYEFDSIWLAGSMADIYGADNCTFVGLPEVGQVLVPSFSLGISAQSAHKEQCWQFIREFLLKDAANNGYIPLRRDRAEQQMLDELEHMKEYTVEHPGRAELMQEFLGVLENINAVYQSDAAILRIIKEETNKLYDGRYTVEETANAIQSRASIYVAEQCG